jgi:hypothetical protein
MCHLWKQFPWWFLSRQWFTFPWLFLSREGLWALRNHASALELVSVMISESAATQFSLTICDSTGANCADESMCHLWKQFWWWFWGGSDSVFLDYSKSTWVVCAVESMHHLLKQFPWWFLSRQRLSFRWLFQSQKRLCALMSLCVSSGTCFGDEFWVGSD